MGRKRKNPLYTLPHGIEVIGEYPPAKKTGYYRLYIRAHHLFDSTVKSGNMLIRKNRVIMTSIVGRKLLKTEIVHHKNGVTTDDRPENLELIDPASHNTIHKTGFNHSDKTKNRISKSMKLAFREGRHSPLPTTNWIGRNHSDKSKIKISESHKQGISNGRIKKPTPPVMRGEKSATSKLTENEVIEIRRKATMGVKRKVIAKEFGLAIQSVYNIINRTTWRHVI